MAQALPSFVELLASLDLESAECSEAQSYARYPTPSFTSSSPSSSLPSLPSSQASSGRFLTSPASFASHSPSIVISHPSPVDDEAVTSRRRSISNRYNPYVPPSVFTRRRSLPGDLTIHPDDAQKRPDPSLRASSASPPMRRSSLGNLGHESSIHLIAMSGADQPISALVRRRHPHSHNLPQSPKTIRRSVSPSNTLTPVSLPSLPPLPRIWARTDSSAAAPLYDLAYRPHTPASEATPQGVDLPSRIHSRTPQSSSPNPRDIPSFNPGSDQIPHRPARTCVSSSS